MIEEFSWQINELVNFAQGDQEYWGQSYIFRSSAWGKKKEATVSQQFPIDNNIKVRYSFLHTLHIARKGRNDL